MLKIVILIITWILLTCVMISGCSLVEDLIVGRKDTEIKLIEGNYKNDKVSEVVEDIIEEEPYVRTEETVDISTFTETELKELRQRFFMSGIDMKVSGEIDDALIGAIRGISLDENLGDLVINLDDLKSFLEITEIKYADTSLGYMMLVNKEFALRFDFNPGSSRVVNVDSTREMELDDGAATSLELMFAKAKEDGINLVLVSAYRDFELQNTLYYRKVQSVGYVEAGKYVARPGESEHQTGLAADISCASVNFGLSESFKETPEYEWLMNNAGNYGYILRYLEGASDITGYSYEPWHFRYIGDTEIANFIMENKLTFEEYHNQYFN